MSSFWNLFGGEKEKGEAEAAAPEVEPAAAPLSPEPKAKSLPAPEAKAPPALPPKNATPRYGIDDAIKLMRTLPVDDNVDLVVRVIKKTLESLQVRVPDIIDDATKRQDALRSKIGEYRAAIQQFEREIDARRHEIGRLEDELSETTTVRERLQLAENTALSASVPPVKVTSATPSTTPGPAPVIPPAPGSSPGSNPTKKYEPTPPNLRSTGSFRPKLSTDPGKKPSVPPPTKPDKAEAADPFKGPPPPPVPGAAAVATPDDDELPIDSKDVVDK